MHLLFIEALLFGRCLIRDINLVFRKKLLRPGTGLSAGSKIQPVSFRHNQLLEGIAR